MRSPMPCSSSQSMARGLGRGDVEAVEEPAVDLGAVARVGPAAVGLPVVGRLDRAHDGQPVRRGEGPVALVLGRHGHDRPGPVSHEDVVGDVDRDGLAVEGVDHVAAGERAALVERRGSPSAMRSISVSWAARLRSSSTASPLVVCGELVDQGVLGGDDGVGHAEAGVRAAW